jgi:hypothetical protein
MTDNKLFLISALGTYMEEKIKIPNNITIIYLSSETEEIDLIKIKKIIDFNKMNDFINNYSEYLYKYESGEMINNNYFSIMNGIITKYDHFNNNIYTLKIPQGLYQIPNNNLLISDYTYSKNINYMEKELIEKSCMKDSIIKNNFTLNDIFNEYSNKKYHMIFFIMASRNNINTKEYINNDEGEDFI